MNSFYPALRIMGLLVASMAVAAATPGPTIRKTATSTRAPKAAIKLMATRRVARLQPMRVVPLKQALRNQTPVTLTGAVTGQNGIPLAGATVWVSGTTKQVAVTNAAGSFSITLPSAEPIGLSCGYGGYKQQAMFLQSPEQQRGVIFTLQATNQRQRR
ncbi:hypothetical protein HMJ29_00430 [Hymenobacter taeanensis]|uniref:Carboxypeptidase-like regulatory domain-containing protein n=1 Tax=Hymenobacter taeanensis TaxID=2735321 RepID=A0A6M6BE13_9BACT|nr:MULTISPECIES: carboxypeptidase regulatory-like domain-containing protein [Hymenobacter]QJX45483.1 hypothetical protein HMJ29_00430 [Hymenobacter taeanensis]UOQ81269.1 carboxypeptidase-like regulatory domain-containing protein [Hymenobacter sp. 5414T-23]